MHNNWYVTYISYGRYFWTFCKIMSMGIFENEIFMMSNSLRKMQKMLGTRLGANVLYFRMERPVCLILEDLSRLGFRMADRFRGLDFDHSKLTLQSLGKFHAASVALCEKVISSSLYDTWRNIFMRNYSILNVFFFFFVGTQAKDSIPKRDTVRRNADRIQNLLRLRD